MPNNKELRRQLANSNRVIEGLIKENRKLYADKCAKETEIAYLYERLDRYEMCYHFPHSSAHGFRNENEYLGGR